MNLIKFFDEGLHLSIEHRAELALGDRDGLDVAGGRQWRAISF